MKDTKIEAYLDVETIAYLNGLYQLKRETYAFDASIASSLFTVYTNLERGMFLLACGVGAYDVDTRKYRDDLIVYYKAGYEGKPFERVEA